MKIPKQVKIGGHIYSIDFKNLEDDVGQCDTANLKITIEKDAKQSIKESTLLHEAVHAMNPTFDDGDRHALMDSLTEQIYQFLKDNNFLK